MYVYMYNYICKYICVYTCIYVYVCRYVVCSLCQVGALRRAEELYEEQGLSVASATALIAAHGRRGDASKARDVFERLREHAVRPGSDLRLMYVLSIYI